MNVLSLLFLPLLLTVSASADASCTASPADCGNDAVSTIGLSLLAIHAKARSAELPRDPYSPDGVEHKGKAVEAGSAAARKISSIPLIENFTRLKHDSATPVGKLNKMIEPTLNAVEVYVSAGRKALSCNDEVRIIFYNAERGRTWKESCHKLQSDPLLTGAHVYLLNEMDNGMARTHNEHTTALLAKCLGMNYVYGVEFVELTSGQKHEQQSALAFGEPNSRSFHGNAILSAFPLEDVEVIRLPGTEEYWHKGGFDGEYRLGGRMALFATLPVAGAKGAKTAGALQLVATHLDFFVGEAYNERSAQLISEHLHRRQTQGKLGDLSQGCVLAGDLGSPGRSSRAADYLVKNENFFPTNHSHPADCGMCSGDWIMLRGLPKVTGKHVVSSRGLSDHNFLVLDLDSVC